MRIAPPASTADTLACFALTILCLCTLAGIVASWWVH